MWLRLLLLKLKKCSYSWGWNVMSILEFCRSFVGCNTIVCLYKEEKLKSEQGNLYTEYKCIWKGMEWQIEELPEDEQYFKIHTDVEKCPFRYNNVKRVIGNIDSEYAEVDKISIIIEE